MLIPFNKKLNRRLFMWQSVMLTSLSLSIFDEALESVCTIQDMFRQLHRQISFDPVVNPDNILMAAIADGKFVHVEDNQVEYYEVHRDN